MSVFTIFEIASQGMTAQRERLEAAAANLANANSSRSVDGGMYRRRDVVFEATNLEAAFDRSLKDNGLINDEDAPKGVTTKIRLAEEGDFKTVYKPGHPDADENGYLKLPNIEPLEETVNMMSATRSFEANATIFNTAKEFARVSLGLGDV